MQCSRCGAVIDDQSSFCDTCGAPVGAQAAQYAPAPAPAAQAPYSGYCIAGLILPFLFLGFIGLPLSILGLSDCKKNGKRGREMGIAGVVLNILNIVTYIVTFILLYFFALGMRPH